MNKVLGFGAAALLTFGVAVGGQKAIKSLKNSYTSIDQNSKYLVEHGFSQKKLDGIINDQSKYVWDTQEKLQSLADSAREANKLQDSLEALGNTGKTLVKHTPKK